MTKTGPCNGDKSTRARMVLGGHTPARPRPITYKPKWVEFFSTYTPTADTKDFLKLEIASSAAMRGYIAKPM